MYTTACYHQVDAHACKLLDAGALIVVFEHEVAQVNFFIPLEVRPGIDATGVSLYSSRVTHKQG